MTTIYNLQLARAIGALLVVFAHIGVPGAELGHFGVDIFFVISGFIMTMICHRSPRHFFLRRLVRIVPLYWLTTLVVFAISLTHPELLNSTKPFLVNLLRSLFFIPYVKANGTIHPMLDVGWTLNYEMFFYAALALSLRFVSAPRAPLIASAGLLVIVAILQGVMRLALPSAAKVPVLVEFYGSFWVCEFILGVAVYYLATWPPLRRLPVAILLIVPFLCLLFLGWNELDYPFGENVPLLTQGVPALLFVASFLLLEQRKFVFTRFTLLGDASYALYLTNQFVVEGFRKGVDRFLHLPAGSVVSCLLIFAFSSLLAILLYRFLEKPMHDQLRLWTDGHRALR